MSNPLPRTASARTGFRWIPALTWLRTYDKGWLRGDIVAGVTLAAYLLPAGLGDASLANLPPEAGLDERLGGIDRFTSVADVVDSLSETPTG